MQSISISKTSLPFQLLLLLAWLPYDVFAITYSYDDLSRLVTATYQNGNSISYVYDQAGNLLNIAIKTTIKVSGTVLDTAKKPIEGATVQIGSSTTTTDSAGYFAFTDLSDATYQVTVSNNGYTTAPITFTIDAAHRNITLPPITFSKTNNYLVIASSGQNEIVIRDMQGNLVNQFLTGTESDHISIATADFNKDGIDNLVISVNQQLMFYENNSISTTTQADRVFPLLQESNIATLTAQDGQVQIVKAPLPTSAVELYTTQGKFITAEPMFAQKVNFTLATGDIDGDGKVDYIAGLLDKNQVVINGKTSFNVFESRVQTRDGKRDDDKDEKNQKVTVCHNGKEISIAQSALTTHLNHGDTEGTCPPSPPKVDTEMGTTDDPTTTTTNDDAKTSESGVNVTAGDLDNDGKVEIVAAMAKAGGTVEIYRGDGSLISSFQAFDTTNGVIVITGDINNDGMVEIIAGDAGGTEVRIFTVTNGQTTQLSTLKGLDTGVIASLAFAKQLANQSVTPTPTETPTTTDVMTPPNLLEVYAPTCQPATDGIHLSCAGNGMILTGDMMIESYLSISDVKIAGYITNYGWLGNITVFLTAIVTGGTLTGDVENNGLIIDVSFRGHKLKGGKLKNRIKILADVSLRLGIVEDVVLEEDTHLSGGRLQGKIQGSPKKPALLEDTEIAEGTYLSHVIIGKGVKFLGRGAHEEQVQRIKVTE